MKRFLFEEVIDDNIKNKLFELAGGLYYVTQNPDVSTMGESDIIAILTLDKNGVTVESETGVEKYALDKISNVYVYRNDTGSVYITNSCQSVTFTKKLAGAMNYGLIKKDDYDAYMEEVLTQEAKARELADNQAQDQAFIDANSQGEEVPTEDAEVQEQPVQESCIPKRKRRIVLNTHK